MSHMSYFPLVAHVSLILSSFYTSFKPTKPRLGLMGPIAYCIRYQSSLLLERNLNSYHAYKESFTLSPVVLGSLVRVAKLTPHSETRYDTWYLFQRHIIIFQMYLATRLFYLCCCLGSLPLAARARKLENWSDPEVEGSVLPSARESARRQPKFFFGVSKLMKHYSF